MNDREREIFQELASAAIHVIRADPSEIGFNSPLAIARFTLSLQLARMGLISQKEAVQVSDLVSIEVVNELTS